MDDLPAQGPGGEGVEGAAVEPLPGDQTALEGREDSSAAPSGEPAGRPNRLRLALASGGPGRWRRRATGLVLAAALVLGFSGAARLATNQTPSRSETPTASATRSGPARTATMTSASNSPSGTPGTSPTAPEPSQTPPVTALPSQVSPAATITFNDLLLDSSTDPKASAQTFSFTSDGPGVVSAEIVATSPLETTKLCVAVDASPEQCASGATPGFTLPVTTAHSNWIVSVSSANEGTPTVDVAFSWPTDHPSIFVEGGRFQGSPNPDSLRSLTATFMTRAAGQLKLSAAWPPATVDATVTLSDVSGAHPVTVDTVTYRSAGSISPAYTHAVAAHQTYTLALFDASADAGRPRLAAMIWFP